MMKRMLWLLPGMMLFSALQAQVYEWFDEHGNRHFSDKKPEGMEFRLLDGADANLSSYTSNRIQYRPPPIERGSVGPASPNPSRESTVADTRETKPANCAGYLARINRIHDRLRAGYDEPTGNRLRAERSALRRAYRRHCN